jgi:magnesium-transporting ATPase (P-type)
LEKFSAAELGELLDGLSIPEVWDSLSETERIDNYLQEQGGIGEHERSTGLIAEAEKRPRTIAFTVLAITQMFEVMAIHAGDRASFFRSGFKTNRILLFAVIFTTILQLLVIYVPFFQGIFETTPLSLSELLISIAIASAVLFAVELEKLLMRRSLDRDVVQA